MAAGKDAVLSRDAKSPSPTGGAGSKEGSCWRRPCGCGQKSRRELDEAIAEMFEWRQQGTPFNQPCCGSVFKNPGGPELEAAGGPRTAGQLIEAAGLKGFTDRGGPGLTDARELLREHRQCHRSGREDV